jgi:hypothetical protein
MMKSGVGIDPLKDLAEAARDELRTFSSLLATIAILGHWCWSRCTI